MPCPLLGYIISSTTNHFPSKRIALLRQQNIYIVQAQHLSFFSSKKKAIRDPKKASKNGPPQVISSPEASASSGHCRLATGLQNRHQWLRSYWKECPTCFASQRRCC